MLRVLRKNCEPIRYLGRLLFLFLSEDSLELLLILTFFELGMLNYFLQSSIARDYISFNNFLEVFKLLIIDSQFVSY